MSKRRFRVSPPEGLGGHSLQDPREWHKELRSKREVKEAPGKLVHSSPDGAIICDGTCPRCVARAERKVQERLAEAGRLQDSAAERGRQETPQDERSMGMRWDNPISQPMPEVVRITNLDKDDGRPGWTTMWGRTWGKGSGGGITPDIRNHCTTGRPSSELVPRRFQALTAMMTRSQEPKASSSEERDV